MEKETLREKIKMVRGAAIRVKGFFCNQLQYFMASFKADVGVSPTSNYFSRWRGSRNESGQAANVSIILLE